ncbi:hypothetical protein L9F63_005624, partial [Diploptera punctata]
LGRAIHALCRIGDELYVEPEPSKLSFRAVSSSKSAYASFTFFESFFSCYKYEEGNSEEEDITCKVSMKSCLAVFRSPAHLDKQVESCQIKIEPGGVKLVFELHCHHGTIKTHYLPIIECETLEAVYRKDSVPNCLVVQSKLLTFSLTNFQQSETELSLIVSPQKMLLRNYNEDDTAVKKGVRTEFCLERGEFDHYSIGTDTSVTFCLKEFRALLQFSEAVGLPITANFETGGRPIVFVVTNSPTFESNFVFATLMPSAGNNMNNSQQSDTNTPESSRNSASFQEQCVIENDSESFPQLCISESIKDKQKDNGDEETVPGTPPPQKKPRYLFSRCFQDTFNSQMLPGYNEVLAEDSDEEVRT